MKNEKKNRKHQILTTYRPKRSFLARSKLDKKKRKPIRPIEDGNDIKFKYYIIRNNLRLAATITETEFKHSTVDVRPIDIEIAVFRVLLSHNLIEMLIVENFHSKHKLQTKEEEKQNIIKNNKRSLCDWLNRCWTWIISIEFWKHSRPLVGVFSFVRIIILLNAKKTSE